MTQEINDLVHMENELIKLSNFDTIKTQEVLKKHLNQKILKNDNTIMKKYNNIINFNTPVKITPLNNKHIKINNALIQWEYIKFEDYGFINLELSICFSGGSYDKIEELRLNQRKLRQQLDKATKPELILKELKALRTEIYNKKPYCNYVRKSVYLGKHENGIITEVQDYKKLDLINAEEETKQYEKVIKLKEQYNEEYSKLNNIIKDVIK